MPCCPMVHDTEHVKDAISDVMALWRRKIASPSGELPVGVGKTPCHGVNTTTPSQRHEHGGTRICVIRRRAKQKTRHVAGKVKVAYVIKSVML